MQHIYFATRNAKKCAELQRGLGFRIPHIKVSTDPATMPPPVETGKTFYENALIKARALWLQLGGQFTVMADDSGLEVDALNGEPGVDSAIYAGVHGNDQANLDKLLEAMRGKTQRSARFRCCLVLIGPDGRPHEFYGSCEGEILSERKGTGGFGYDPIFKLKNDPRTMAEIPADLKDQISHRAMALDAFVRWAVSADKSF